MDRNIVLICLDTVRQDYFKKYATRLLDRGDVVFTQCRAASGWSIPSHASMFTGKLPHQHKVHTYNRDFSQIATSETLISDLSGYKSIGVSSNIFVGSEYNFDIFFDDFYDISPYRRFPEGLDLHKFTLDSDNDGIKQYYEFLRQCIKENSTLKSFLNGAIAKLNDEFQRLPITKLWDDGASLVSKRAQQAVGNSKEPFFCF